MAKERFLDIDMEIKFSNRPDIINNIFEKKKLDGEPYQRIPKSVWPIKKNKKVWFPYIAVIDNETGAWKQQKENIDWINIPSPDERAITEIPIKTTEKNDYDPKDEFAVFGCIDEGKDEKYRFYGIYSREQKENGICIWKRKSPTLDTEEWKAEE